MVPLPSETYHLEISELNITFARNRYANSGPRGYHETSSEIGRKVPDSFVVPVKLGPGHE
jgi:hypothetical protein